MKKHASFKDFWDVWIYADLSIIFFRISVTIFKDRSDISHFKDWWKYTDWKRLINRIIKTGTNNICEISAFSLIILDGISESWQAFYTSKFKVSFKISSLSTYLKENRQFLLHTSPIVLGWFLYFTIAFKTGSWMFSANGLY